MPILFFGECHASKLGDPLPPASGDTGKWLAFPRPRGPRRNSLAARRSRDFRENPMNRFDRRSLLTSAAAATGAAVLAPLASWPAFAAAPMAGTQNAGWYRY